MTRFDKPSPAEQSYRRAIVEGAKWFRLDGSHLPQPVIVAYMAAERGETLIDGRTRMALDMMYAQYVVAGINATTTATYSAVNLVRAVLRVQWEDALDTRASEKTEVVRAFALAMKFFHSSIRWAEEEYATSEAEADAYARGYLAEVAATNPG